MPLSEPLPAAEADITDIDALAATAQALLRTATRTDAIRIALERVIATETERLPLAERLKAIQDRARALGTADPDFDEKAFTDSMWER